MGLRMDFHCHKKDKTERKETAKLKYGLVPNKIR